MQYLSTYSLAKLRALEVQVIEELKTRHFLSVSKAREQILKIAQDVGIPVKELLKNTTPKPITTGTVKAKYRNPGDHSQQWSGRGRQPSWLKTLLASGKTLEDAKM